VPPLLAKSNRAANGTRFAQPSFDHAPFLPLIERTGGDMRSQIVNYGVLAVPLKSIRRGHTSLAEKSSSTTTYFVEETLVVDERASRRPAQAVEDKLSQVLQTGCIGVSQMRLKSLLNNRGKND
jgi:hypothetical protein